MKRTPSGLYPPLGPRSRILGREPSAWLHVVVTVLATTQHLPAGACWEGCKPVGAEGNPKRIAKCKTVHLWKWSSTSPQNNLPALCAWWCAAGLPAAPRTSSMARPSNAPDISGQPCGSAFPDLHEISAEGGSLQHSVRLSVHNVQGCCRSLGCEMV